MLFRLLFAAAVGDCYLNGPCIQEEEKLVAIALSIAAVLLNEQYAFILAELAWFIVFARAGLNNNNAAPVVVSKQQQQISRGGVEVSTSSTTPSRNLPATKPANECPALLKKAIDESAELFLKNREGSTSCDNLPWELVSESDGDKVWRVPYPKQSIYRWRAQSTLFGPKSGILGEMFDYAKRAGKNGWDANLAKGRIHKEYDGGYKIMVYSTNPVMGGVISPREFFEARIVKPDQPGGAFMVAGVGLDEKVFGPVLGADFPKGDPSCTRAQAFPGGGFYMYPVNPDLDPETPQEWNYQLVVNTVIGGWVPASTINSATGSVMADSLKLQKAHMLKMFKRS